MGKMHSLRLQHRTNHFKLKHFVLFELIQFLMP